MRRERGAAGGLGAGWLALRRRRFPGGETQDERPRRAVSSSGRARNEREREREREGRAIGGDSGAGRAAAGARRPQTVDLWEEDGMRNKRARPAVLGERGPGAGAPGLRTRSRRAAMDAARRWPQSGAQPPPRSQSCPPGAGPQPGAGAGVCPSASLR
ncbi:translation initiation factor IF-2-like isoform X2 [Passer montanus]|uniref:translation initiation factor IF-2-like isoform X2 n=1 Tax=Passer montanus TaxID=9160 RepID=UPI00196089B0|nr:translation initiation factor IF-2-like isoform X2 [Passer montanus]